MSVTRGRKISQADMDELAAMANFKLLHQLPADPAPFQFLPLFYEVADLAGQLALFQADTVEPHIIPSTGSVAVRLDLFTAGGGSAVAGCCFRFDEADYRVASNWQPYPCLVVSDVSALPASANEGDLAYSRTANLVNSQVNHLHYFHNNVWVGYLGWLQELLRLRSELAKAVGLHQSIVPSGGFSGGRFTMPNLSTRRFPLYDSQSAFPEFSANTGLGVRGVIQFVAPCDTQSTLGDGTVIIRTSTFADRNFPPGFSASDYTVCKNITYVRPVGSGSLPLSMVAALGFNGSNALIAGYLDQAVPSGLGAFSPWTGVPTFRVRVDNVPAQGASLQGTFTFQCTSSVQQMQASLQYTSSHPSLVSAPVFTVVTQTGGSIATWTLAGNYDGAEFFLKVTLPPNSALFGTASIRGSFNLRVGNLSPETAYTDGISNGLINGVNTPVPSLMGTVPDGQSMIGYFFNGEKWIAGADVLFIGIPTGNDEGGVFLCQTDPRAGMDTDKDPNATGGTTPFQLSGSASKPILTPPVSTAIDYKVPRYPAFKSTLREQIVAAPTRGMITEVYVRRKGIGTPSVQPASSADLSVDIGYITGIFLTNQQSSLTFTFHKLATVIIPAGQAEAPRLYPEWPLFGSSTTYSLAYQCTESVEVEAVQIYVNPPNWFALDNTVPAQRLRNYPICDFHYNDIEAILNQMP
jgi:hypothetical protein